MAARKRESNVKYTGELAKPIYKADFEPLGLLNLVDDAEIRRAAQEDHSIVFTRDFRESQGQDRLIKLWERKIELLFEHYRISSDAQDRWHRLVIELAFAHVPGMAVAEKPSKRGPKPRWSRDGERLIEAVEAVRQRQNLTSDRAALQSLKDEHPQEWKSTLTSLETRLREARRRRNMQAEFIQKVAELSR